MSCITQILEIKGDKEYLPISTKTVIEGGGVYRDYEYLITMTYMGHRCGYVALKGDETCDIEDIDCHGGITFYDNHDSIKEPLGITCPDVWVGFDAGHCYDRPDFVALDKYKLDRPFTRDKEYRDAYDKFEDCHARDFAYMEKDCKGIIDQLIGGINNEQV